MRGKILKNVTVLSVLSVGLIPSVQGSGGSIEGDSALDRSAVEFQFRTNEAQENEWPLVSERRRPKMLHHSRKVASEDTKSSFDDDNTRASFSQNLDFNETKKFYPQKQHRTFSNKNKLRVKKMGYKKRYHQCHSISRKRLENLRNRKAKETVSVATEGDCSLSQTLVKNTFKSTFKDCLLACYRIFAFIDMDTIDIADIGVNGIQENITDDEKPETQQQSFLAMEDLANAIHELVWLISTDGSGVFNSLRGTHEFEVFKEGLKNQIVPGRWVLREYLGPEVYDEILSLCESFEISLES